ncbi:MAG: hypothetical protein K0U84_13570 [Actinomycetia bacterium]|nr:hypothetical protein [Actinomycetes bacterium]
MQPDTLFHMEHRRWWVFFGPASQLGWFRPFLRDPQFQHVFALSPVAEDVPIVVNPTRNALEVALPLRPTHEAIRHYLEAGFRCLVVEVDKPDYNLPRRFLFTTCVTIVAHAMGLGTSALSPKGLWRAMKRAGAREVTI